LSAVVAQRASGQYHAKPGGWLRSQGSTVSDFFMLRAEAMRRGSVQRFVESAMQSKAGSILKPQDPSLSLMKDLWKMQSALCYLGSTDKKNRSPAASPDQD